jgi:glucose-6-phosphate 1-epimerase
MDQSSRIDDLNNRFGISELAKIVAGNDGLPKVRIATPTASAGIYLHGAHVTSWQPSKHEEVLFVSHLSHWQDGRAIRGGIPVCFPWFRAKTDDPQAPSHGFVRTREWRLDSITAEDNGSVCVVCSTESDETTRQLWPHDFRLIHRVTVGTALRLELITMNTGSSPFRFEEALHTYFKVGSVEDIVVGGLDQVVYLDNNDRNRQKVQSGDLRPNGPTDNAYIDTKSAVEFADISLRRKVRTDKENSATTIIWNPWSQGAARLSDLGADEWRQMVCIEASNILSSAITLPSGEQHVMTATLSTTGG